jgi:hypothetical protein
MMPAQKCYCMSESWMISVLQPHRSSKSLAREAEMSQTSIWPPLLLLTLDWEQKGISAPAEAWFTRSMRVMNGKLRWPTKLPLRVQNTHWHRPVPRWLDTNMLYSL